MKTQPILNPMVFVKDENSPEFRAHMIRRAQEATDPKNRSKNLSVAEAREHLARYRKNSVAHGSV
jgi:hypothetical protein